MSTLYILTGLPGSGKSSFCNRYVAGTDGFTVVSTDEIRRRLCGGDATNQDNNGLIFAVARREVHNALTEGRNVVFDATNLSRRDRRNVKKWAPENTKIGMLFVDTPFEECAKRNSARSKPVPEKRMTEMAAKLQRPTADECDFFGIIRGRSIPA